MLQEESCIEEGDFGSPPNRIGSRLVVNTGGSSCFLDDDLAVLPRHTKVIVTGNNRTKSVLIGLHGIVKKAVGLGGWHWLVLTNGLEVKLQRNALSVLERPTGLEEDGNDSDELLCGRSTIDDFDKARMRMHKPNNPYRFQKGNHIADSSSTGSKTEPRILKVDLNKLTNAALVRYWRRFNLLIESGPNPTREQLVDVVQRHFKLQKIDEHEVVARFIQATKRLKTVYG